MTNLLSLLNQIRQCQTEIMRHAPFRDIGLVPNPRASEQALLAAESRLGFALPNSYRAFLSQHDGWPRFFEGATLLGTANIGLRSYDDLVHAVFDAAETPLPELAPPSSFRLRRRPPLVPFGADLQGTTVFAFNTAVRAADGEFEVVAWVNELGLRRETFTGFLESVLELCEAELQQYSGQVSAPERFAMA